MEESQVAQMPDDWNDHADWEAYYRFQLARTERDARDVHTGSIGTDRLPQFAAELKANGWRTVWVPGCGLSPLAYLLSRLGLEVTATDVSPTAVAYQRDAHPKFGELASKLGEVSEGGLLTVELHDFRTQLCEEAFDVIINVKAIQAFPLADMVLIAQTHAKALRPGRYAYFDTMNVQGNRRDQLEQALEDGGFVVPFQSIDRWYRGALNETGIPYVFILGHPIIPRTGVYTEGGPKWEADMARLREISAEYDHRRVSEQEGERSRIGPKAKIAQVIYSTG
jgi:hypothetical protein